MNELIHIIMEAEKSMVRHLQTGHCERFIHVSFHVQSLRNTKMIVLRVLL